MATSASAQHIIVELCWSRRSTWGLAAVLITVALLLATATLARLAASSSPPPPALSASTVVSYQGRVMSDCTVVSLTAHPGSTDPLSNTASATDAAASTITSQIAGPTLATATAGARWSTTIATCPPGLPFTVTLVAVPPSIPIEGNTSTLTATVLDRYGNLVPDGWTVTFHTSLGAIAPVSKPTSSGLATVTLFSGIRAGPATVTATVGSVSGATEVVFTPGPPALMTLTVFPLSIPIGGFTATITVTQYDLYGNCVPNGTSVNFETTLGTFQQSGLPTYTTTFTNCIAVATLVSGLSTGTAHVFVVVGGWLRVVDVTFTPGPPRFVIVTASPPSIPIAGRSSIVAATVRDMGNNPVANGTVVTFTTSLGTVNPPITTTTDGIALATLTSGTRTGTAIVTATVGTVLGTTNVTFTTPFPPSMVVVTAYPPQIPADGMSTSTITATVTEFYGNPVADGTAVYFFVTPGATIAPSTARTVGGIATATLTAGTAPMSVVVRVIIVDCMCGLGQTNVVLLACCPLHQLYMPLLMKGYIIWVSDTPTPNPTSTPTATPTVTPPCSVTPGRHLQPCSPDLPAPARSTPAHQVARIARQVKERAASLVVFQLVSVI